METPLTSIKVKVGTVTVNDLSEFRLYQENGVLMFELNGGITDETGGMTPVKIVTFADDVKVITE